MLININLFICKVLTRMSSDYWNTGNTGKGMSPEKPFKVGSLLVKTLKCQKELKIYEFETYNFFYLGAGGSMDILTSSMMIYQCVQNRDTNGKL